MTRLVANTQPYPWPYDGRLDGPHLALLLAGWDDGWAARAIASEPATANVAALAGAFAAAGLPIVAVAHDGAAVLTAPAADLAVAALGIDGFHGGPLDGQLRRRGLTHLVVAGHGVEAAVHSTLRSANDRGYECLLVADACTSLTADLAEASAKTVTMSGGIFGAIGATADVVDALAATPDLDPIPVPASAQEA